MPTMGKLDFEGADFWALTGFLPPTGVFFLTIFFFMFPFFLLVLQH